MTNSPDRLVALYETTVDDVYRYASRLTGGDRAWTDDLVQETYLAVLRRLRRGESLDLSPGYLIVTCRHRFFDGLKADRRRDDRERRRDRQIPATSTADDGDGSTTAALAALPVDQRCALVLHYVDDLSVADVARHLDRSVRATESLLARARTALRNELNKGTAS